MLDGHSPSLGAPPPSPPSGVIHCSPGDPRERRRAAAVRFADAVRSLAAGIFHSHRPRAWRAATPYPHVAPPTGDNFATGDEYAEVHMPSVDMESCRRLAYTFVEPACADPGLFIRNALEQRGGDPPFCLAPSSYGTMMVVFRHVFFREEVMRCGPLRLGGHTLRLERHEEDDFWFVCRYRRLAVLAATKFPPEH